MMNDNLSHKQLCERAAAWLRGNRRCDPVLTKVASAGEIPDAIGWSSSYKHLGSIVIECKTSRADFHNDRKKYTCYRAPGATWTCPGKRFTQQEIKDGGYTAENVPNMGDYRFFLCRPGIIDEALLDEYFPDHGLIWMDAGRVRIVREAQKRANPDRSGEIRYLRFALIHLRDNLLGLGLTVDTAEATKFFGRKGITLPTGAAQ